MTTHTLSRNDTSIVGRWWWTVDKWLIVAVTSLLLIGIYLTFAAEPAAGEATLQWLLTPKLLRALAGKRKGKKKA